MKDITKLIINRYHISKLGYDFMGYNFISPTDLSYHHTILEREEGGEETIENGVVLVRKTSHDYVHIIERHNKEIFMKIRQVLIDEIEKGIIDMDNLKRINELLLEFEMKHGEDTFKDGTLIIRDSYKERLLNKPNNKILERKGII